MDANADSFAAGTSGTPIYRAIACPDGSDHVRCRNKLRAARDVGGGPEAMAPIGRSKSGVERRVSISLFGFTSPSSPGKRKKVDQPTNRRGLRAPPRRSDGSAAPS